jgi:hypothetical protein
MQTFLPWMSFRDSAADLDRQRLGKQRVETLQILQALARQSGGWSKHPAVRMWEGSELLLVNYGIAVCDEWISRGYADTCREKIAAMAGEFSSKKSGEWPRWLGDTRLHQSHRFMLYAKDPEHYRQYRGSWDPNTDGYFWPTQQGEESV